MLTLGDAIDEVKHAAYGETARPGGPKRIIDQAARRLLLMHPWHCTERTPRHVGVRAAITFTGATWTAATRTLTKASAFTSYTFAPEDSLSISAGATANFRDYDVQEKVSANAVILTEDIGATDGSTDIGGTLNANHAAIMPSDFFGGIRQYGATQGIGDRLCLTSRAHLTDMRVSGTLLPVGGGYWGALWQANNVSTAGGAPVHRLELWPYPTAADPDLFTLSYTPAWSRPSVDTAVLPIPALLEDLFLAIIRAVTLGYEEEEQANVDDRIAAVRASSLFFDATNRDGLFQPTFGPIRGGGEEVAYGWPHLYPDSPVADPA